jgi:hypothetical protein
MAFIFGGLRIVLWASMQEQAVFNNEECLDFIEKVALWRRLRLLHLWVSKQTITDCLEKAAAKLTGCEGLNIFKEVWNCTRLCNNVV